jgi:hypothetical protein
MIIFLSFRDCEVIYAERVLPDKVDVFHGITARRPDDGKIVKLVFKKYMRNKRGALFIEMNKEGEILGG